MSLHRGWEKMLVLKNISNFENNRIKKQISHEKYQVNISNERIFKELSQVFSEIQGHKNLYIKLFEDMNNFDFINISSVVDELSNGQIPKFKEIKLYDHTLNTFFQMTKILKSKETLKVQKDIFLLIALLHDFGKSHKLCENYGIDLENEHHVRSAQYFNHLISNSTDNYGLDKVTFEIIYKTLNQHHEIISTATQETIFLQLLKEADAMARKVEEGILKNLKEKNNNKGNLI